MENNFFTKEILLQNEWAMLEPLNEKHYEALWLVARNKELWQFTTAKVNTEDDFKRYFNKALSEKENHESYPFAIFDKQQNKYAGSTRFANISFENKRIEIGWTWYHPQMQRTGLNRACKFLLLSYGFEILDLNRIELKTALTNIKSQTAIEKIGATKEGVFRNHFINEVP
jgi:RimJ/RimL family protein N-acetyltransferase